MKISKEELKVLSDKLLFDMSEKEYEVLANEFEIILDQMEMIDEIENLEDIAPMVFPYIKQYHDLREDIPSNILSKEDVLKNASESMMDMIKVKKVVG